ncbi:MULTISPECIES: transporter substrate-binding domain-containing protein [unclassified Microbacterium]|uniref:transporter substrate-binding domain-containing protein n=1 Tax=unclassified Microbacterium TaxID=2609290 RepID=UPI00214C4701|nr:MULTISPECIES: transporter substrate-binding domain-containing protein [unclassified Microbacterium]MCR2786116.1 transporter substrate-binding domain-containing protein [Microbacterium sp. zg.B96]WIM17027.1 transporter substrate-binding domain-containing protein [Microbacterium sp. zg-B96]
MKMRRAAVLLPLLAMFATAGCASDGAVVPDPSDDAAPSGVNTDAPLYDSLPEAIQEAGVIVAAGDTHPPYRAIEEGGEITGIDPDIQAALSEQLGVPFEIVTSSGLDAMLTGMLSGRFDAFNGPVRVTPERLAEFDGVVWMTTRTSYIFLAERETDLGTPEAVCGARVAGVTGSVTESQLARYNEWCAGEGLPAAEFIGLEDSNQTFLAVNSDRADFAGTTQSAAIDLSATEPGAYGYLIQSDDQGAGVDLLAMFMPKDSGLADPMLAAFEAIFENGEYERIMAEWGIKDAAVDEPLLNPAS